MKYFMIRSDGAYVYIEGMSEEDIISMLAIQSLTCEFITEETFLAHQVIR